MSLIGRLAAVAVKLAPSALAVLVDIAEDALKSDNPELVLRRRLEASSEHLVTQGVARETLDRLKQD